MKLLRNLSLVALTSLAIPAMAAPSGPQRVNSPQQAHSTNKSDWGILGRWGWGGLGWGGLGWGGLGWGGGYGFYGYPGIYTYPVVYGGGCPVAFYTTGCGF